MKPLLIALFVTAGLSSVAHADDPAEERFGEFHVTLKNAEYCKVAVNGAEWTATEFERNGKLLMVKALRLDEVSSFDIELTPFSPKLAPVTITVEEKEFRRVRKGRVYYLIAKAAKPVTFPEAKPDEEPTPDGPKKPEPPEEPTGPPDGPPDL
ncbi:MAG: hypothetical protein EP329_00250 [Deltaproteobacteria bacterium]|nr:MAG: hypothetical protein EP329_00250 [Deltaproteobacteria bacterium]